jgi:ABC-2 type transport system permease protein
MHPQFRRFRLVAAQELRLLLRDRSLWLVGALFLLLVAYALVNGLAQVAHRDAAQAALLANDAKTRASQLLVLERIYAGTHVPGPFTNPASPSNMAGGYGAHHAAMPSAPLAPVALGQNDLFPTQFRVTHQSKVNFLHNNDIENPWHLLSGHFDLAFVIVYLLPLLIFALSYNLLSGEKEDGTLRLLLSQPLSLSTLIAGKVAVRAAVLLGASVLVPALFLLAARPQAAQAGAATLWWVAIVGAYALFWFALVIAVNAFGKSSATNAMVLVIGWVLLVLVVPVLLNLLVTRLEPSPSRAELATRTRVVTAEAMARNAALLSSDYKHMEDGAVLVPRDGKLPLSGRPLANLRIQREVDERIRPELERFDAQQARQQALVARLAVWSPAAVAHEGMTALAGTGRGRHAHFLAQVGGFHERWKAFFHPRIDAGDALDVRDFAAIPAFRWEEQPASDTTTQAAAAFAQIALPALVLLVLAAWRLRRYRVA